MAGATRLFLALWPDPAVREQLREWRELWAWPRGATPVHTDKLHLTLHFLGNQPSDSLPALLDGLAVPMSPFRLQLGVAELWHKGIAVLSPSSVPQELLDLHAALARALTGVGLPLEPRAYRPHVTMARRATGAAVPPQGPAIDWLADHYALVESKTGDGSGYTVLREYR
ncbi:2'-5' RNA ligase [Massilia sp. WF1]|nr:MULTISPECIES: RNA 2',3'-cyclic phosphodiesterase [unclassified Massilia]ALK99062.1 2'-5' RNA ligase [Massilia sp. WG5]KLU36064.1 2'-5' RNA ligase [Massilia sp. WF1]